MKLSAVMSPDLPAGSVPVVTAAGADMTLLSELVLVSGAFLIASGSGVPGFRATIKKVEGK